MSNYSSHVLSGLSRRDNRYYNKDLFERTFLKKNSNILGKKLRECLYRFEIKEQKCERCGWNKTNKHTNTIPVEVHHINGDKTDNRLKNIIILCPNCHSLTKNYRGANKNSSKKDKKVRRSEGIGRLF